MKILFLSWNSPQVVGGIEYVVGNLFEGLRSRGHRVRLVTAYAENVAAEPDIDRAPGRGLKRYVPFSLRRGLAVCRAMRPEVILCGSLVGAPAAYVLSRLFGAPYYVIVHGSDILRPGFLYQRAVRFLLNRAAGLIANSGLTRRLLEQRGLGRRVRVIYPGVRVQDFEAPPAGGDGALGSLCEGRKVVLAVGRLIRRKGVLEFVENVMPALAKDCPEVLFLIVGDDATASLVHPERLREKIAAAIRERGLEQHVKLLGKLPQEQLLELLWRADVFVMPCLDLPGDVEGFGIVFQEAALAGTASVGTRVGGIPEAIVDGQTGLLAEPGDWEEVRRHVLRLLSDESLRQNLASAGAQRARSEFSWENIVAQYEAYLGGDTPTA